MERNDFEHVIYTDGSKTQQSTSYSVTTVNSILFQKKLHPKSSIYTAEALGILKPVKYIIETKTEAACAIITDSLSVIEALYNKSKTKNEILNKIIKSISLSKISIVWVPSHFGIPGNKYADKAAVETNSMNIVYKNILSPQDLKCHMKTYCKRKIQEQWNLVTANKFHDIHPSIDYQVLNGLNQKEEMIINRLKIGHSFLTHQHKLSHEPPPICEWCARELDVQHIFDCSSNHSMSLRQQLDINNLSEVIFDESKYDAIFKYLQELDYYNLI